MSNKYRHGYAPKFRKAAADYYDVDAAIRFLDSALHANCHRWRCVLCGWPIDVTKDAEKVIGACCCGGCGMTTLRPIEEWSAEK